MLIEKSNLKKDCLKGTSILLTGGGGGIGYETARALVWLGADVIIAEINEEKGTFAAQRINNELNTGRAHFYKIDLSIEEQIDDLCTYISEQFGSLDVIFNNATITPFGAVEDVSILDWDKSYAVNLRAPVLLTQRFLPDMKKHNKGTIVFVPSSGAAPYMGAYEVFKTAQVELSNTLAGELETNIITYSIGPGLVKTETAQRGIETIAKLMKMSTDAFYQMNEKNMLDAEAAGTGFAISVALADKYNGQEISSIQALNDAKVFTEIFEQSNEQNLTGEQAEKLKEALESIVKTYHEQYDGWIKRNVFERQWVLRDFKKTVGISVDEMKNEIIQISNLTEQNEYSTLNSHKNHFISLKKYYERQYYLLQGYEKDPYKLRENSDIILSWIAQLDFVLTSLA